MPVSSERYITSIANGQNGTSISDIKILHHFVHLPFSNVDLSITLNAKNVN